MTCRIAPFMLLVVCSLTAWAQVVPPGAVAAPAAPGAQPDPQELTQLRRLMNTLRLIGTQQPVLIAGEHCVYLLRNGELAQYDGHTPQPAHQLALYGPMPAQPAVDAPFADRRRYAFAAIKRLAAPTVLLNGDELVIVTNEMVFCVDAATLQLISATSITTPAQTQKFRPTTFTNPPAAQVIGHIAYVLQGGTQLIAVDLRAGKLLGRGKMPDTMALPPLTDLFKEQHQEGDGDGPGMPPPPALGVVEVPRTTTRIGTVHHLELEGGFWAFEVQDGQKFVLAGEKLKELVATPHIDGARVRIAGTVGANPAVAMYGNGALMVKEYQVLPAAVQK